MGGLWSKKGVRRKVKSMVFKGLVQSALLSDLEPEVLNNKIPNRLLLKSFMAINSYEQSSLHR